MTINKINPFRFIAGAVSYDTAKVFYARLDPEIATSSELLQALYYILWFPGYFGFNWDALYDCLRDLNWIHCRKVVIVHEKLPMIPEGDLTIYLETLRDSVFDWGQDKEHELEIVFQESDKNMVEKLLCT